ncbi:MAG: DUF1573 domain-containing protein [Bacteroidales bacterium]|nr:DUF1573 domain-containing protein [Bacteroidales bacterium]
MKYICMCFFFLAISCNLKKRTEIEEQVKSWQGKEILFPENAVFVRYGSDTVDVKHDNVDYKVLLYLDSAGCSACQLKPRLWKNFMQSVDSVNRGKVSFLFFVSPKNIEDIIFQLKEHQCDFPICFNKEKELDNLNHFPKESMFRSFLLDANNKVLIVGNPINNPRIGELYLKEIEQSSSNETDGDSLTEIHLIAETLDVGILQLNERKRIAFEMANFGTYPYTIEGAVPDCDCTDMIFTDKVVMPGETATVFVEIKKEVRGRFTENVNIFGNTVQPVKLTVTGDVR